MFDKTISFLKKDFLIEKSYKFTFALSCLSTFFTLLIFFFIDKLYASKITPYLQPYSTGFFGYIFISVLLFNYTGAGLGSISEKIRTEKMQGTFEAEINNEKIIPPFFLSIVLFNLIITTIETLIYISFGILVFDVNFKNVNFISLFLSFGLSVVCFSSIGIISSCFIILFRRGNPVSFLLNTAEGFFGGVYFPVAILPMWCQYISKFLPITYAINAIQKAVHSSATIFEIKSELIVLLGFSIILLPVSIYLFKWSIIKSKIKGNLSFY